MSNITEYKTYEEIDNLVEIYKNSNTSTEKKKEIVSDLILSFHVYFMKYVYLLKGYLHTSSYVFNSKDTLSFLALFAIKNKERKESKTWQVNIYKYLKNKCSFYEQQDIYNEICLMFIELLNKYTRYPGTSFVRYITKYLRWHIKKWVLRIEREPLNLERTNMSEADLITENDEEFYLLDLPELSLAWIIDPKRTLFSILTPYERFLLYLVYKEGMSLRQISNNLGRHKDTIHSHIKEAILKLKNNSKEINDEKRI